MQDLYHQLYDTDLVVSWLLWSPVCHGSSWSPQSLVVLMVKFKAVLVEHGVMVMVVFFFSLLRDLRWHNGLGFKVSRKGRSVRIPIN